MIFDSIKNRRNYKDYSLLYEALCFLARHPDGLSDDHPVILIPDKLFCNTVELLSRPEEECTYEAHKKYIDLHYIISGTERIATSDTDSLILSEPYSDTKDIEFLEGSADGYYDLKPGQFMVCFPNDAHKVGVMVHEPCAIKKIVFKIIVEV